MDLHSENANKDNFSKFCEVFLKNLNAPISPRFSTKSTEEQISLKHYIAACLESRNPSTPCRRISYLRPRLTLPTRGPQEEGLRGAPAGRLHNMITQLKEFDGKKLICVLKEGLKLEEREEKYER
ncbi:hypothetical protein B0H19DRAFT_1264273 [Mycena capillaripes]|nr:hypothetical protein B0H19DRAFT_1264273 [Mycena capillaripes]